MLLTITKDMLQCLVLGSGFSVLGSQCCMGSQYWVLGSGFRDWVLSAGFSVLGTRFWVQGLGSQCWVLGSGFRDRVLGILDSGFSSGTGFWVLGSHDLHSCSNHSPECLVQMAVIKHTRSKSHDN